MSQKENPRKSKCEQKALHASAQSAEPQVAHRADDASQAQQRVAEEIDPRRSPARATGPRTEAGKKTSSRNSTRHGIFANSLLIEGESSVELYSLLRRLKEDESLEEFDKVLREVAATISWRYARFLRADGAEIVRALQFAEASEPPTFNFDDSKSSKVEPLRDRQEHFGRTNSFEISLTQQPLLPPSDVLDRHIRYESHLLCRLDDVVALMERVRRMRSERRKKASPKGKMDLAKREQP